MSVRKEGNGWRADVKLRLPDGRVVRARKKLRTKREAEMMEHQLRKALIDGTYDSRRDEEPKEVPKLAEWASEYMESYSAVNNKESTQRSKKHAIRNHILPVLGEQHLDEIGRRDIEKLKAELIAKGLKSKTINNYLTILRNMLATAQRWDIIEHVPVVQWLKAERPRWRWLDERELELLLAASGEWRSIILVAVRTGLRAGELRGLQWGDIDFARGTLMVSRNIVYGEETTPKSGRSRVVPLADDAMEALRGQRHLRGPFVWPSADGTGAIAESVMLRGIRAVAKKAGIGRIAWHVLRHTFASQLVIAGVPIRVVQELLGHATISMTERYSHVAPDAMRAAVQKLSGGATLGPQ